MLKFQVGWREYVYKKGEEMKSLYILPILLGLCACDRTNFHETNIECLNVTCVGDECSNVWDKYKSLDVDSEKAVLRTDDRTIVFKLYTQDATEETSAVYADFQIYKNENDEQPMFLHFVDNDTYSLGTDLNHWSQCRKARK